MLKLKYFIYLFFIIFIKTLHFLLLLLYNFKDSSESPVPKIVGLAEFLTSVIPMISSSFELLFDRYCKIPNLTKSVDVVLIKHNDNTGSSSTSTKGEPHLGSSINDESGKSFFYLLGREKFPHSTTCRNT